MMKRNLIYICSLSAFFLMWVVFGFASAAPREKPASASPLASQQNAPTISESSNAAGIPVTGQPKPSLGMLLNDGLAGLAVLVMILIVLGAANKPTSTYVQRNDPPDTE